METPRELVMKHQDKMSPEEVMEWNMLCGGYPPSDRAIFAKKIDKKYAPLRFDAVDNFNHRVKSTQTTQQMYYFLKRRPYTMDFLEIHCRIDNITVGEDEFCEAFEDGEYPSDLQFF